MHMNSSRVKKSRKTIVIYGAGAIGRGYIPWVFSPDKYELVFVERNDTLRGALQSAGSYTTYKTAEGKYESMRVPVKHCFAPGEEKNILKKASAVVTAVGPRNILSIAEPLRGTRIPIICCENDPTTAEILRTETKNPLTVFAVPDVITSNSASAEILKEDPLGIITEDGHCIIDERAKAVGGHATYVSATELKKQWMAKLYLHNTPHCIAAYLGSFLGATYVHETMAVGKARAVVEGAMREMQQTLLIISDLDKKFVEWYAEKELQRFANGLLFDPVSRVAREPFRKLAPTERLLGAAQLCLSAGVYPENMLQGIVAAFLYDNPNDPDANIRYLVRSLELQDFLRIVMGLDTDEALQKLLVRNWKKNVAYLKSLS